MPQSFHQLYAHLIFSTKNREPFLQGDICGRMHGYLSQLCRDYGSPWVVVGGVADHVHIALDLGKKMTSIELIANVKKQSSAWIKERDANLSAFYWQKGYGLFSFGALQRDAVEAYVRNQAEHHRKVTFQEEYRSFLDRYNIQYDEKYVWD
ncbi:IS200/IS605 family transposase [Kiritimatiellaeota bacterium B1221]|nr:IS200/IS605 family transposase [Kiritimatiellaeota bacterium B1221]